MNNFELQFQVCDSVSLAHNALPLKTGRIWRPIYGQHVQHKTWWIWTEVLQTCHTLSFPAPSFRHVRLSTYTTKLLQTSRQNVNRCYFIFYLGHINTAADYDFNRNSAVITQPGLQPGQGEHCSYRQNHSQNYVRRTLGYHIPSAPETCVESDEDYKTYVHRCITGNNGVNYYIYQVFT